MTNNIDWERECKDGQLCTGYWNVLCTEVYIDASPIWDITYDGNTVRNPWLNYLYSGQEIPRIISDFKMVLYFCIISHYNMY